MRTLFQYRSISGESLAYTLDSLLNSRFFLSDWRQFNDKTEGAFAVGDINLRMAIIQEKIKYKITCFTLDPTNVLMWGYYADRFSGVCLELSVSDHDLAPDSLTEVIYSPSPINVAEKTDWTPKDILSRKHAFWQHEKEIRLVTDRNANYLNATIRRVILGPQISSINKDIFLSTCSHRRIPVSLAQIDGYRITVTNPTVPNTK